MNILYLAFIFLFLLAGYAFLAQRIANQMTERAYTKGFDDGEHEQFSKLYDSLMPSEPYTLHYAPYEALAETSAWACNGEHGTDCPGTDVPVPYIDHWACIHTPATMNDGHTACYVCNPELCYPAPDSDRLETTDTRIALPAEIDMARAPFDQESWVRATLRDLKIWGAHGQFDIAQWREEMGITA
jgi:hypothetical protein